MRERLLEPGLPLEASVAINKAIWRADIGSVAALRWLLPVAELVERLLLAGTAERRELERRGRARPSGSQRRNLLRRQG